MTEHRLGIIMNGVTGRMGTNQHLIRSILAIMKEGGVIASDAVRHPLEPLHPETRRGLLELASELDVVALRWGN